MEFYYCSHCGNIIIYARDQGVPVVCCGEQMGLLLPGRDESLAEEHSPVATLDGNTVNVQIGSKKHPMTPAHHIMGIILETDKGFMRTDLEPIVSDPEAVFLLPPGQSPVAAYAYCNLHRLWVKKI